VALEKGPCVHIPRSALELDRAGPVIVDADQNDDDIRPECIEHAREVAAQARRVGPGKTQVEDFHPGAATALIPDGFELLRIGLVPFEPQAIGIGIAEAEYPAVARDPRGLDVTETNRATLWRKISSAIT
jgi:hypothetical protein